MKRTQIFTILVCSHGILASACGGDAAMQGQSDVPDAVAPRADADPGGAQDGGVARDSGGSDTSDVTCPSLRIHTLDMWASPLHSQRTLRVTRGGTELLGTGSAVVAFPACAAGKYEVSLAAPEYESLAITVDYDGSGTLDGFRAKDSLRRHGVATSLGWTKAASGERIPALSLYLGLRHKWFSAEGRPARRGNQVTFLMDGEEAWGSVSRELKLAKSSIHLATWWWQSDFELVREQGARKSEKDRWANTILGHIESSAATKRVLVGQFWGQDGVLGFLTRDAYLKKYAEAGNDKFEFMGMANTTEGKFRLEGKAVNFGERVRAALPDTAADTFAPDDAVPSSIPLRDVDLTQWPVSVEAQIASYHQKFAVIDGTIAFVGGMNLKENDWDTSSHKVYEPRRMSFGATSSAASAVDKGEKLPDQGPRKDYMVRIDGPAVQDVSDVFRTRWRHQLDAKVDYSQYASDYAVSRSLPTHASGIEMQVTATLPEPFNEHAIAESWLNAVGQAEEYIFIEDQYFRAPMLNDAIAARMAQRPNLRLIVITKPVSEWGDPGCRWTAESHALFSKKFTGRYLPLKLIAFAAVSTWGTDNVRGEFADIDVHSKMLIVDDKFMSVGSANKNNRGMVYEGELNVALLDAAWVRAARERIFANMLPEGTPVTHDASTFWQQFIDAADHNDSVYRSWDSQGFDIQSDGGPLPSRFLPRGFVYSLVLPTVSDCLIEDVGPDMTIQ